MRVREPIDYGLLSVVRAGRRVCDAGRNMLPCHSVSSTMSKVQDFATTRGFCPQCLANSNPLREGREESESEIVMFSIVDDGILVTALIRSMTCQQESGEKPR